MVVVIFYSSTGQFADLRVYNKLVSLGPSCPLRLNLNPAQRAAIGTTMKAYCHSAVFLLTPDLPKICGYGLGK